jgi:hypothetical protein
VRTGNYGKFSETSAPSIAERHVIRAEPGETPTLSGVTIDYGSLTAANLTLSGFVVNADGGTLVTVQDAEGLRLSNLHVWADKYIRNGAGADGIKIFDSRDVVVDHVKIDSIHRGMQVAGSDGTRILNNFITVTAGTGIQYLGGNSAGLIAYNHITGADYTPYPADPNAPQDPHASIISFRSDDVVLKGNHLHSMGTSSGIMFYGIDAAGGEESYDNILIENNAIYDVSNVFAVRFSNLGSNVVVRNNLIFTGLREGDCNGASGDARYRYNVALIVKELAPGSSGIELYNNVFVGAVFVSDDLLADERNNFAWSWADLDHTNWRRNSASGTSQIITSDSLGCGNHDPLFEDGSFFSARINANFPGRNVLDVRLAAGSPGWNFGDPAIQSLESLGSIDTSGFVSLSGPCRGPDRHSAGPYEFAD